MLIIFIIPIVFILFILLMSRDTKEENRGSAIHDEGYSVLHMNRLMQREREERRRKKEFYKEFYKVNPHAMPQDLGEWIEKNKIDKKAKYPNRDRDSCKKVKYEKIRYSNCMSIDKVNSSRKRQQDK